MDRAAVLVLPGRQVPEPEVRAVMVARTVLTMAAAGVARAPLVGQVMSRVGALGATEPNRLSAGQPPTMLGADREGTVPIQAGKAAAVEDRRGEQQWRVRMD